MGSIRSLGKVVSVTGLLFLTERGVAQADNGCTVRDVHGNYGYTVNGSATGVGPIAAVGLVNADGAGGLSATETDSINGTIVRRTITGSYTVNANCSGTVAFTDNFNLTTHLDFVIVKDGQEFRFVQTDPGNVTTGVAEKQ